MRFVCTQKTCSAQPCQHVSAGVEKLCNDLREDPSSRRVTFRCLHCLARACTLHKDSPLHDAS